MRACSAAISSVFGQRVEAGTQLVAGLGPLARRVGDDGQARVQRGDLALGVADQGLDLALDGLGVGGDLVLGDLRAQLGGGRLLLEQEPAQLGDLARDGAGLAAQLRDLVGERLVARDDRGQRAIWPAAASWRATASRSSATAAPDSRSAATSVSWRATTSRSSAAALA